MTMKQCYSVWICGCHVVFAHSALLSAETLLDTSHFLLITEKTLKSYFSRFHLYQMTTASTNSLTLARV